VYNTKISTLNAFKILVGKEIGCFRNPCMEEATPVTGCGDP
jgi:hypothetical protein